MPFYFAMIGTDLFILLLKLKAKTTKSKIFVGFAMK